jgi:long-chain-alcohol oxidase
VDAIPRNAAADHHCGHCSLGCRNGGKQATTETWLVDATSHGAVILTGCKAEMVLHESYNVESSAASSTKRKMKPRKAKGVFAKIDGSNGATARLFISAKATVVACGSLSTPSLLLRSGLKNSNIGKHLHLHPVTMAWSYFPQSTGPNGTNFEGTIMSSYSKVVSNNHHEYDITTATNKSLSQSADHGTALLEVPILYPGMFAGRLSWRSGSEFKNRMCRYSRTAHILVLTRDKGSGTVRLDKDGEAEYDYPFAKQDAITMAEGVEKALRVFIAAGAVEVGTHIVGDEGLRIIRTAATGGGAPAASSEDDDVEEYLKRVRAHFTDPRRLPRVPLDSAHQMGSCRMGIDPMTSAVDPRGETWDVEGLFVADASVFPSATGVNPMVSVQSIAYCTGQSLVRFIKYGHSE